MERPDPQDRPVTAEAVLHEIAALLTEIQGREHAAHGLRLDASLERDFGLDSLSRMELGARLERRFSRRLSRSDLIEAHTPRQLLQALEADSSTLALDRPVWPAGPGIEGDQPRLSVAPDTVSSLTGLLEWQAGRRPDDLHVRFLGERGEARLTYGQLLQGAREVASGLQADGIPAGSSIALMLPSGLDYFRAFFGVLLAGGVPVPIYPPVRPSQLEEHLLRHQKILANAQVRGLIGFEEILGVSRLLGARVRELERVWTVAELSGKAQGLASPVLGGADTAFLQYTSGSTGNPKGVVLRHDAVLASLKAMGQAARVRDGEVFVSWLPLYHDMGLIGAWLGSLYHGMPMVLMSPLTFLARPASWLEAISRYHGTLSGGPNFAFELCARRISDEECAGLDLSGWRMAFNGAEPVDVSTMRRFAERFAGIGFSAQAFAPVYGLAEATLGVSFTMSGKPPISERVDRQLLAERRIAQPAPAGAGAVSLSSCGTPIPGFEVRTVDASGRETGEREVGAIQFKGPGACSGYFRNPEATAGLFDGDWLVTGDIGYLVQGQLFITGREKDLIIRGGRNISPYEIEAAAADVAEVRRGCVAAVGLDATEEGTERLVVIAESRERDSEAHERIRAAVQQAVVDATGQPVDEVAIVPPGAVLKTSSGKIRRVEMASAYREGRLFRATRSVGWQITSVLAVSARAGLVKALQKIKTWLYSAWWWCSLFPFALGAFIFTCACPSPRWGRRVSSWMGRVFFILAGTPLRVHGTEHLPAAGPYVLVSNHASYMDGLLMYAALPGGGVPWVVKGELAGNALARRFLGGLGSIFVDRFNPKKSTSHLDKLVERLEAGQPIGVFPEGTLHRMPGLLAFQPGAFLAAVRAGVPVVPMVIRGTRSMLRDGAWFARRVPLEVQILEPLWPASSGDASAFEKAMALRNEARSRMLARCGEPDLGDRPVLQDLAAVLAAGDSED